MEVHNFVIMPDDFRPSGAVNFSQIDNHTEFHDHMMVFFSRIDNQTLFVGQYFFSACDSELPFHVYMRVFYREILKYPLECLRCYKYSVEIEEFSFLRDNYPEIVGKAYLAIRMARRIRSWWTHIYYSPETHVGRSRLEREVNNLVEEGILSEK